LSHVIGVGQLGAGFIGRAHSLAYRNASFSQQPLGASVALLTLVDRDEGRAAEVQARYGWQAVRSDWAELVDDPAIVLFDNAAPNNLHVAPCIAAAERGKHVLCEKPLARSGEEALGLWQKVRRTGVLHQCGFMYRFIPALDLARQLVQAGELGEILHFRARFLLSFAVDARVPKSWRFDRAVAGAGALGDLGSHHIDLARFLVAEVERCAALTKTYVPTRQGGQVTNDDAFVAIAELANGATATFEGSRVAGNHALTSRLEVDGTRGSLAFDFERLNELSVSERGRRGFRTMLVTGSEHPYSDFWFPVGIQGQHPLSWADCFAHQAHTMLTAIASGTQLPEHAPTFRDGYRVAEVVDTIDRAAVSGSWERVVYRSAEDEARAA
jgi:predicted dehydrogenase